MQYALVIWHPAPKRRLRCFDIISRFTIRIILFALSMGSSCISASPQESVGNPHLISRGWTTLAVGTLIEARNATSGGDSPVVNVDGESIPFESMNFGVNATGTGSFFTGGGGDTGDEALNTVLNSHVWSGSAWSFTLSELDAGVGIKSNSLEAAIDGAAAEHDIKSRESSCLKTEW